MKYEKLPHDIIHIRRKRREAYLLTLIFVLVIFWILVRFHIVADLFRVSKHIPEGWPILALGLINVSYIAYGFAMQEKLKTWVYQYWGNYTDQDFIKVFEGKYASKFPAPKIIPVWIAISAKCGPIILVSVIPYVIFALLGWNLMQYGAILLFFLYSGDVISALYYIPFCDKYMIEYIKQGEVIGIDYFDIYFFSKENAHLAQEYIGEKVKSEI